MIDFIAEVSSNHNRDLGRMKEFIHVAKECGSAGIKFQLFKVSELFAPEVLAKSQKHRDRINWELDEKHIPVLSELAHKIDLSFSCTPFYLEAVDLLNPYVDFHKSASYELLWLDLFEKCGRSGKPVVFSTGMATVAEVRKAVKVLEKSDAEDVTILHCNSAYPTPVKDSNLSAIVTLRQVFSSKNSNLKFGYSDHTVSPAVIYRAVNKYSVSMVEFHLDIEGKGEEYTSGHCWLPNEISAVIANIKIGFDADGDGEFGPSQSELPDRNWRADPADGLRPIIKYRKKL